MNNRQVSIPDELIMNKILIVRGVKVMIDSDLAELYGVTTKRLNEQVKRNIKRFPEDFMFRLTEREKQEVVANCDHLERLKFSPNLPYAFTEHGAVMLASVLNSDRAIIVNIQIVRVFNRMRQLLETHTDILRKLELLQKKDVEQDRQILLIFEYLKQLEQDRQQQLEQKKRKRIGFKRDSEA
ncbi:MAG TPA: ORF6N domain-containing protein [Bacteroidales bacterium]|nr:ORF6N domain-containing protein [Bacteroidales bacterium]HPM93185.1 ORF6N domain-containing protein [Bacteroidales bacterium]